MSQSDNFKQHAKVTGTTRQRSPEAVRRLGRALIALARAQLEAEAQAEAEAKAEHLKQASAESPIHLADRPSATKHPTSGDAA
ncbi:MAG TPA: hypothetical protein VNA57_00120 [Acidimicrobiales bacterium]|nr:hypothetical protein [Acidimicrobiales bacterium]